MTVSEWLRRYGALLAVLVLLLVVILLAPTASP